MSLATRCPACQTTFRVVQDQLKVSSGWVRCGRCGEVFSALETLFDLDRDAGSTSNAPTAGRESIRVLEELQRHSGHGELDSRPGGLRNAEPAASLTPAIGGRPPAGSAPSVIQAEVSTPESKAADLSETAPPPPLAVASPGSRLAKAALRDWSPPSESSDLASVFRDDSGPDPEAMAEDQTLPSFVAQADRAARWQSPTMRGLLGLIALLLLGTAVAQWALVQRDYVAVRWPEARPWLEALCEPLDCQVEPLRGIDKLAVESTALTQAEGGSSYRLSVTLRNRGDLPLLLPALELSLNDTRGQLIARRVIRAGEAGVQQTTIGPGAELPLQLMVWAGERRLTGYTVEIFYP